MASYGHRRHRRRHRSSAVTGTVWSLAAGTILCAFAAWSFLVASRMSASFARYAVPATAVIERIVNGHSQPGPYGPRFDEYASVIVLVHGRDVPAFIPLNYGCLDVCLPPYKVGQKIDVFYDPRDGYVGLSGSGGNAGGVTAVGVIALIFGLCFLTGQLLKVLIP